MGDHAAAGIGNGPRPGCSVIAHAGQHDAERGGPESGGDAREHGVDRRPAEMHWRLAADAYRGRLGATHRHMMVTGRHVDRAGLERLTVYPLLGLAPGGLGQPLGEDRGEHRRHVLRHEDGNPRKGRRKRAEKARQHLRSAGRASDRDHPRRHHGKGALLEGEQPLGDFGPGRIAGDEARFLVRRRAPRARPPERLDLANHLAAEVERGSDLAI